VPGRETKNQLLAQFPEQEFNYVRRKSEITECASGDTLYEMHDQLEYVYFPEDCVVSMVLPTEDGFAVEVGIVGRDGMAGLGMILKSKYSMRRAQVQIPGRSRRLSIAAMEHVLRTSDEVVNVLFGYARKSFLQASQTAICNARHRVDERLARSLLMVHDVVDGDDLALTHEFIANMLGSRRAGVTVAIATLRDLGAIGTSRGVITIVDRHKLEKCSCECYSSLKAQLAFLE
jgi:CRP-like cAMP-binding protein